MLQLSAKQPRFSILLVEDNEDDALIARYAFKNTDYEVELNVARDGLEALDMLYRRGDHQSAVRPNLLLLDLNMPGMDGRELLNIMKQDERLRSIPVVVFSTSDADVDVNQAYDAHANAYMTKPIDYRKFNELVKGLTTYWHSMVQLPRPEEDA